MLYQNLYNEESKINVIKLVFFAGIICFLWYVVATYVLQVDEEINPIYLRVSLTAILLVPLSILLETNDIFQFLLGKRRT